MNREQSMAIVAKLHNAYQSIDKFVTPSALNARIEQYTIYFADIPYRIVDYVVNEWIKTRKELPFINELLVRCKDELSFEQNPIKNTADLMPTWWYIAEARGVDIDAPIPPEITKMTDRLIEALRKDPKIRAEYEANHRNEVKTQDGFLPYEI